MRCRFIIILLIFCFGLLSTTTGQNPAGDELKIGYISVAPFSLNPLVYFTDYHRDFCRLVFGESLYQRTHNGQVQKSIGADARMAGKNNWIITSRSDAFFHDGSPVTAKDIKFSYELYKKFSLQLADWFIARTIKKIDLLSDHEIRLELFDSGYDFPDALGILPILPASQYQKWLEYDSVDDLPEVLPVGAGYFKYDKKIEPDILRVVVNNNHFAGRANLQAIEFRLYETADQLVEAFLKGEVDLIKVQDRSVLQRIHQIIQMDATKMVINQDNTTLYYILLNSDRFPFNKQKIRQALSSAVNREQMIAKILLKTGHIAENILDETSEMYFNSTLTYPYNPRRSIEILNSIGYKRDNNNKLINGQGELKFELLIEEGSYFHEMIARLIAIDLGELGINVIPVPVTAQQLFQRLATGKFQAAINHFVYDPLFSEQAIRSFYYYELKRSNPFPLFQNPQVEHLLKSSEMIFQKGRITPIMHRIQYLLSEQAPCIYLFFEDRMFCAISHRFENYRHVYIEEGNYIIKLNPENEWYVPKEKQKYR